jgi:glutamate--cysteine ligase catalytic subunit
MGMCCLQVTFQARDVNESRYMFDQLHVLSPIMMALTAATPIFKGRLSDIDARWTVIEQSVDCRTDAERSVPGADMTPDLLLAGGGVKPISKSRYDSISTYIYQCPQGGMCPNRRAYFNDIPCEIDEDSKALLLGAGVDEGLAHHIAHLFARDPLVIFEGGVELDDWNFTNHFENIQSTNWQTVRWKPPPPRVQPDDPHIGIYVMGCTIQYML